MKCTKFIKLNNLSSLSVFVTMETSKIFQIVFLSFIPIHLSSVAKNSDSKSKIFLSSIEVELSKLGAQLAWLFLQMEIQIIT